jgi:hypothetical protein
MMIAWSTSSKGGSTLWLNHCTDPTLCHPHSILLSSKMRIIEEINVDSHDDDVVASGPASHHRFMTDTPRKRKSPMTPYPGYF